MALTEKEQEQQKKILRNRKWFIRISVILFVFYWFSDYIVSYTVGPLVCLSWPKPLSYVNETVEFPGSVYWEDNVFPGFDREDRKLTIRRFLDGVHLKQMALNDPEGNVHWFESDASTWESVDRVLDEGGIVDPDRLMAIAGDVEAQGKVYTRETMPAVNYKVTFDAVPLNLLLRNFMWADQSSVIDMNSGEVIAERRRLMMRWPRILPDVGLGDQYYYSEGKVCGNSSTQYLDYDVFTNLSRRYFPAKHNRGLTHVLFHKEREK